jgi:hypothetical protein
VNCIIYIITGKRRHCEVCAAGAIIAKTFGAPPDLRLDPNDFDGETARRLRAVNKFRNDSVRLAFAFLGLDTMQSREFDRSIPLYADGPEGFKTARAFSPMA